MALPPGHYVLDAYNEAGDGRLNPLEELILTGEASEVDLGVLRLAPARVLRTPGTDAVGDGIDGGQLYGKEAPRWQFKAARGHDEGCPA